MFALIRVAFVAAFVATSLFVLAVSANAQTKLLRFPDIRGDRVVFTYAGDLWTAPSTGGSAVRLTSHPGVEVFGKFSPDGKWVAFTGQYDGDEQVYVVPAGGGEPRQLTFYPARGPLAPRWGWDNQVYGWSKDGQRIFFRFAERLMGASDSAALFSFGRWRTSGSVADAGRGFRRLLAKRE